MPKLGGQFELATGGQFKSARGGQFDRNLQMGAPKREKDLRKYLKVSDELKSQSMDNTWNSLNK